MLRISQNENGDGCVGLRLEGELAGPWVAEVGRVCSGIVQSQQPLSFDLKEVSFVDREGIRLLASLLAQTVELKRCSPFLREQLRLSRA
jgi:ABC-type transporter Mla MlaB component